MLSNAFLVLSLALVSACESPKAERDTKTDEPAGPKDAKALFASKSPELPGLLAKLTFDMTKEQVRAIAPELLLGGPPENPPTVGYVNSTEYKDITFGIQLATDLKSVKSLFVSEESESIDLEAILVAAWGPPEPGTQADLATLSWFNADKRLRATLRAEPAGGNMLFFSAYMPLETLLGEGKGTGLEAVPILGATYEDIMKNYAPWAAMMEKEDAERMLGELAVKKAKMNEFEPFEMRLLPTEFDSSFTGLFMDLHNGEVVGLKVTIRHGAAPGARDKIFAVFEKKWGKPTKDGTAAAEAFVFHASRPKIVVSDAGDSNAWVISVEP